MTRPRLSEPIEIAKFWKNRGGEAVVIQLREFNGRVLFDARVNVTDSAGRLRPTDKGLTIAVLRLPELAAAIGKALARAREAGLIKDGKP
jgi:hypothetical protein